MMDPHGLALAGVGEALLQAAETAQGWPGLVIVAAYSFLIAVALPLPSEVVLATPLDLGFGYWTELGLIMFVSGVGKAAGGVVALHLGHRVTHSGRVIGWLERRGVHVVAWSRRRTVTVVRRFGYAGLALALSVPFFPDTVSLYAFAILERDYLKFATAAFAGSVGRLLVTVFVVGATLAR